ncbi:DUF2569 domain-containing protein [Photorhabdus temperata]|uniref:DUF2569 domain-containing protein n=2 Tax=Photorhabdus temperata TaxID=574560 RepID=A0A081RRU1_PHOTE|nr:DUF2569 domain-containing protein [Photorhabdus temperata]EQB98703.1 hypothetical protein B738_22978 [Photorhabdus temperata subsp. temperata M1021]ERT10635.1 hypothetical protein O185_23695 [Photorhabdus temperata J3]KER01394.1 Protein of unknown function (DUF2569) [Photorhabdus temperata subsp. temperata Meg1]
MKCIQCENPALHESDFCATCEEKELNGIGGFLYFPAINIIITILTSLFGSYKTMMILISGYDFLGKLRILIGFEFICFVIIFGIAFYTSILFFRKKEKTPLLYIILLVFTLLFVITDLMLGYYIYGIKLDYNNLSLLFRNVFCACIWIPYFIVSIRVKRTFIR